MSLDRSKLQMVRELGNGGWRARCPACAESGQDRKGEHLRISPDGKFGCCVFPGDHEHRKRIFALAGESQRLLPSGPKEIRVKVAEAKTAAPVQLDLLGRLNEKWRVKSEEWGTEEAVVEIGTLGTCFSDPRAYADKAVKGDLYIGELIEFEKGVPGVPEKRDGRDEGDADGRRLPFLMSDGTLVIPFNSPERYHWWRGGQGVRQTVSELQERKEMDASPF